MADGILGEMIGFSRVQRHCDRRSKHLRRLIRSMTRACSTKCSSCFKVFGRRSRRLFHKQLAMPNLFTGILTGFILISASFLLGAFYTHWVVDHNIIWTTTVLDSAVKSSLSYYAHIYHAPLWYSSTLVAVTLMGLASCALKLLLGGTTGMLFDGATLLLFISSLGVYTANVRAALEYLPLDQVVPSHGNLPLAVTEALQSIAASHMIIAVSLTGVLSLQAAQGYSDRPVTVVVPVTITPAEHIKGSTPTTPKKSNGNKRR